MLMGSLTTPLHCRPHFVTDSQAVANPVAKIKRRVKEGKVLTMTQRLQEPEHPALRATEELIFQTWTGGYELPTTEKVKSHVPAELRQPAHNMNERADALANLGRKTPHVQPNDLHGQPNLFITELGGTAPIDTPVRKVIQTRGSAAALEAVQKECRVGQLFRGNADELRVERQAKRRMPHLSRRLDKVAHSLKTQTFPSGACAIKTKGVIEDLPCSGECCTRCSQFFSTDPCSEEGDGTSDGRHAENTIHCVTGPCAQEEWRQCREETAESLNSLCSELLEESANAAAPEVAKMTLRNGASEPWSMKFEFGHCNLTDMHEAMTEDRGAEASCNHTPKDPQPTHVTVPPSTEV